MTTDEKKEKILNFIAKEKVAVVATVNSEGKPSAAAMAVSQTDDLKLIFQTPNNYRKYQNLKSNPEVAVTFGFDLEEFITVQFEGVAKEVGKDQIELCRKIHVAKNPKSRDYAYLPDNRYFIVQPKWIRYWDFKSDEKFVLVF